MEQEKMKRARERDDETEIQSLENNREKKKNAKKRDLYGINLKKENQHQQQQQQKDLEAEKPSSSSKTPPWDSHLAVGVFDFPWLKDGVMSKTEDLFLDFEDKFSSSLQHEDAFHFSEAYCSCETHPEASWQPFESSDGLEIKAEDVDCIWSSLISKNNIRESL